MNATSPTTALPHISQATHARVLPNGRWKGRVTRRDLPDRGDVDAATSDLLSRIWISQAATEARVAHSFSVVHDSLVAAGASDALIALAGRAVDDEHRHAALCEELAGRYVGRTVGPHGTLPGQQPLHEGCDPELRHVLYVVGQCALNETFASAYLACANDGTTDALARAALCELLADEVDHARIGWGFVRCLRDDQRKGLEQWLLPLTVCNLREWRALHLPDDESLAAHGVPSYARAQEAILSALSGVVLEGFAHSGLDTRALSAWIRQGAPT